ncbi:MAG: (d)CMP kinase [Nitrosomonadales bacterium]|jgi:cytidylate kinase
MKIITIDGPAGSGKGTIAKKLADELGFHYLDSGAIYRVIAYKIKNDDIQLDNETKLKKKLSSINIRFTSNSVMLDEKDISDEIRLENISILASKISAMPIIRDLVFDFQRSFIQEPGLIADGRDMGTVVFPEAELKIFLTASVQERAQRRYKQLISKEIDVNISDLEKEIQDRDARDMNRKISPLVPSSEAFVLDTTYLNINEVCKKIKTLYKKI